MVSRVGNHVVIGGKGKTTDTGMHVPLIANWPAKIPGGKVCSDLVDSTDFLPTLCVAAGVPVPASLNIDGRSFFPQLCGEKGSPREWIYCWFSREGVLAQARECAFNSRFKLYRSGDFYDLSEDPDETKPRSVAELTGDAAKSAKLLQSALDRYADARPSALKKLTAPTGKKSDDE
jgi:arylsulfatase A